ncbi:NAD-binding protein [Arsenicicoccus cauae]|uniref:NAD-binding protein n=1 Tax=Arsenicicoccus cauae TaxID=2663847 RepID=UPI0025937902|nr:NAD-binding protein [uncultured Arsenicicoccus sp.]
MDQHVIVVGVETTTVRVVEELTRSRTPAVVVVSPTADPVVVAELRAGGATIVEAARTDERALREAGVHRARAVIVLGRDEVASTRTALAVEDADAGVPIVLEVVNPAFGSRLAPLLGDCTVLSPAQLAAPAFIGAALGDGQVQAVRLGGRDVVVGPRASVAGQVLARLGDPERGPLPDAGPGPAVAAQAVAAQAVVGDGRQSASDGGGAVVIGTQHRHSGRQVRTRGLLGGAARLLDRRQRIVLLLLLGVILASTAYFHSSAGKDWLTSLYLAFTTATGTGYGDPDDAELTVRFTAIVIQVMGLLLASGLTAVMTDALTSSRLATLTGSVRGRPRHHVVVCGLGRIGTAVVVGLRERGIPVVAVERNEEAYGVNRVRRLKVPVVIGEASDPSTLEEAGVHRCDAAMALTDDDAVNLEISLVARAAREDLRIVTRLYDDDLATRVERRLRLGATRSVSMLTAPAFVAAALGRPRSTIVPVGRRVVLLTELQVEPDAGLVGMLPSQLSQAGQVRLLAVRRADGAWVWNEPDEAFGPGDRIAVAATRTGLGQLRLACRPPL